MTPRYCVYRIVNRATGLSYIGVTKMSLRQRWWRHTSYARCGRMLKLYVAMREYGIEQFDIEPIASVLSVEDRWDAERDLIAQWDSCANGYNELPGVPRSVNDVGVPACFTAERAPVPESRKEKMRALFTGRVDSPETRARKLAAQAARRASGWTHPGKGVPRTDAVRERIALGHLRRREAVA